MVENTINYKVVQILPRWITDITTLEFVHVEVSNPKSIGPLLGFLTKELPLARTSISEADMKTIQMKGIEANKDSHLYGEFKMPGVLTNDLANNKQFTTSESNTISMNNVKRVARLNNKSRVLICSKHCWENELAQDVKAMIGKLAQGLDE